MALLEIDQVVVDLALFTKAKSGDRESQKELARSVNGLVLDMHNYILEDHEVIVTLRELEGLNVVSSITVDSDIGPLRG